MVYDPRINIPAYTNQLPDQSALLSPAYRNPFFFNQGQTPLPYYNPFQGAPKSYFAPVEEEVIVEPEKQIQMANALIAQESGGDSESVPAVQGGWSTAGEIKAAYDSGWFGTYADARKVAAENPKAEQFVAAVDDWYTERAIKNDPLGLNIQPSMNKITPTGVLSGLGRIAQEAGLSNAYGTGAIGTNDPVIGDPTPELTSEVIQAGTNQAAESGDDSDHGFGGGFSDSGYGASEGSYGGIGDFNKGGMVMPYYRQEGGEIPAVGPEGVNPALAAQGGQPPVAPAPQPMPMPQPPMRKSFAEKVAEAKELISRNKSQGMPLPTPMPEVPMADAEGDGGVMGDVTYADESVGPDIGPDTVDAKLTPGEFVMNKEATEMYLPEIQKMNEEGLIARAGGGMVPNYEDGGYVSKLNYLMTNDPSNAAHWKAIKETYFQDGSENPITSSLNQLPEGSIGKLGQSLVAIGQRDFKGASDALTPDADPKLTDEQKDAKAAEKVKKDTLALISEGRSLIGPAAKAGDYINGYIKLDPKAEKAINADIEEGGWASGVLDKVTKGLAAIGQTAAGAFDATAKVREEALRRWVAANEPDSYNSYVQLKNVANKMVFPILESGALGVNPTDADVELAKQATFDVAAPSNTWASQLNRLAQRNGGEIIQAAKMSAEQPKPKPESAMVDQEGGVAQGISEIPDNLIANTYKGKPAASDDYGTVEDFGGKGPNVTLQSWRDKIKKFK